MEKILIIDDDPDMVLLMQMFLNKQGFKVATASHEAQVYQEVEHFQPDLIFMDVLLSGSDGRDICKKLKDTAYGRHIPIVIISGHPGAQKNIEHCGADDFLAKPFEESDLLNKIEGQMKREPI